MESSTDMKLDTKLGTQRVNEKEFKDDFDDKSPDSPDIQRKRSLLTDTTTSLNKTYSEEEKSRVIHGVLTRQEKGTAKNIGSMIKRKKTPEFTGFDIHLDKDGWLIPGESLTGSVTVPKWLENGDVDYKVHLVLQGRSKVKTITGHGKSRSVKRSRAGFLYQVTDLQREQRSNWHFDIDVPRLTREIPDIAQLEIDSQYPKLKRWKKYWLHEWPADRKGKEENKPFNGEFNQPLPPTYMTFIKTHQTIVVKVEYAISAYVTRPKPPEKKLFSSSTSEHGALEPLEVCRRVLVVPGSNEALTDPSLEATTPISESLSYIPTPPSLERSTTLLSRVTTNTRNQQTQNLDITATVPQVLQPGCAFDLILSLKTPFNPSLISPSDSIDGNKVTIDSSGMPVDLKSISLKVKRLTNVRTRFGWKDWLNYTKHWGTVYHEIGNLNPDAASESFSHWKLSNTTSSSTSDDSKDSDDDEKSTSGKELEKTITWPIPELPKNQPATFATFNVFVAYKLSIRLTLTVNGKAKKLKLKSPVTMAAGNEEVRYKGDAVPQSNVKAVAANVAIRTLRTAGTIAEIVTSFV